MIKKDREWYDIEGYGHEGKIEGARYNDLINIIEDCLKELEDVDLLSIQNMVDYELNERGKYGPK